MTQINGKAKVTHIEDARQLRYVHLRRPSATFTFNGSLNIALSATGGLTVAYMRNAKDELVMGIARCNATDHYNRKLGRTLARQRLVEQDVWTLELAAAPDLNEYEAILKLALTSRELRRNLYPEVR